MALAVGWCALVGWRAARRHGRCNRSAWLGLVLGLVAPWVPILFLEPLVAHRIRSPQGAWVAQRIIAGGVVLALMPAVSLAGAICGLVAGAVAARWAARGRTSGAGAAPRDDADGTRADAGG